MKLQLLCSRAKVAFQVVKLTQNLNQQMLEEYRLCIVILFPMKVVIDLFSSKKNLIISFYALMDFVTNNFFCFFSVDWLHDNWLHGLGFGHFCDSQQISRWQLGKIFFISYKRSKLTSLILDLLLTSNAVDIWTRNYVILPLF